MTAALFIAAANALASFAFAATAAPPASSTSPLTVQVVIENVEKLDEKLKTMTADFKQFVRWDDSGTAQAVEGTVAFKKKSLLRVEHRVPEQQTIVSDGTWLWVHRKETNQVIQMRLEAWRKQEPLAQGLLDLGGYSALMKKYEVALTTVTATDVEVKLEPKEGKKDFSLTLKLSRKDWFPHETSLKAGDVVVRSRFENVKLNPEIPDKTFKFAPPPGADVFQR